MASIPRPTLAELEAYLKEHDEKQEAEKSEIAAAAAPAEEVTEVKPAEESSNKVSSEKAAKKKKKKKGPFRVIWNLITTLLVIAVVLLAVALVGVRLIGYTPYAVLSPSMTPKYLPGDLIYVEKTDPGQITEGDVITFVVDENSTVVTHRVDAVDRTEHKFYTKGDANENRDGNPVLYENVLGVVKFSLPKLGYVSSYVASQTGRYVAIIGVLVLILMWILPELFQPQKKNDSDQVK